MVNKFIQKAIKHPGALRKTMGVKEGQKINVSKLNTVISKLHKKALTGNLTPAQRTTLKRANLAKTLRGFKK